MNPIIIQKLSEDSHLATILPLVNLPILETSNDIYISLLEAVVSQQLSVKAADTIFKRFLKLFEDENPMCLQKTYVSYVPMCLQKTF